jgi:hypothetical protein
MAGSELSDRLLEKARRYLVTSAADEDGRRDCEMSIAKWLTLPVDPFSPAHPPPLAGTCDGPEARAEAIVSALRERCKALGLADSMVTKGGTILSDQAVCTAADQRKLGQLDDARRTADQLMAIARRLVRDFPDRAESSIVLSDAYCQISKNAWKYDDYDTIERSLGQAVEAARHALELDPGREDSRRLAVKLAEKLAAFRAGREPAKSTSR